MDHLGRYRIDRETGPRGWGLVYAATEPATRTPVVIHAIRLADYYTPEEADAFRGRLLGDVRAARTLRHAGLVEVLDVGREHDLDYVVTEQVGGRTLAEVLAQGTPDLRESLRILADVARVLDHVHERGVVHRYLEPSCIAIADEATVKLAGLGTARVVYGDVGLFTEPWPRRLPLPPLDWASPELIRGEWPLTGRSDQFSLAAVAYRLLTGLEPFAASSFVARVGKIVIEAPPPPRSLNAALRPEVEPVLEKALSKSPAGRYETCTEFVEALRIACG